MNAAGAKMKRLYSPDQNECRWRKNEEALFRLLFILVQDFRKTPP